VRPGGAAAGDREEEDGLPFRRLGNSWEPLVYPDERLHEEVAFIAYHFHWPLEQILAMEHGDRRRWAEEISRINERMNEEESSMVVI